MKTSRLLVVVIALQALVLLGQWVGPSYVTSAQAQANDPARDRIQTLDELRSINAKLDKMADILGSGDLQVRVVNPDEIKGKAGAR
jgi:hypothetical protein